MRVARFLTATMMVASIVAAHRLAFALPTPSAVASHALPQGWDSTIPLPPAAVMTSSTVPKKKGETYSADFSAKGTYPELVSFYEKGLPKAGFTMGPMSARAARKVYNRSFARGGHLNSLVITPNLSDRTKFNLHFVWSPQTSAKKSSAP